MQDYIRSFIYMKSLSGGYYFNLSACWRLWEGGMVKKQEKDCVGKVRTSYRTDESPPIELNCVCVRVGLVTLTDLLLCCCCCWKAASFRSLAFRPSVFPYRVRCEVIKFNIQLKNIIFYESSVSCDWTNAITAASSMKMLWFVLY